MMLARHMYRIFQIKREIRNQVSDGTVASIRINSEEWFRGYGSVSAAFWASLSIFNYSADVIDTDGAHSIVKVQADFHPFWATLRDVEIKHAEQAAP